MKRSTKTTGNWEECRKVLRLYKSAAVTCARLDVLVTEVTLDFDGVCVCVCVLTIYVLFERREAGCRPVLCGRQSRA